MGFCSANSASEVHGTGVVEPGDARQVNCDQYGQSQSQPHVRWAPIVAETVSESGTVP